jgi:hypothetical protein
VTLTLIEGIVVGLIGVIVGWFVGRGRERSEMTSECPHGVPAMPCDRCDEEEAEFVNTIAEGVPLREADEKGANK